MQLKLLSDENYDAYNAFLKRADGAMFYYSLSFKKFLENLLSCESQYWCVFDGHEIVGCFPMMIQNGPLGKVINALPFYGSHGSPLADTQEIYTLLMDKFFDMSAQSDVVSAMFIENSMQQNKFSYTHQGNFLEFKDDRIGLVTELPEFKDEDSFDSNLWSILEKSAQQSVTKSRKEGLEIGIDNSQLDFLYSIHVENMESVGGKPKSEDFFKKIDSYFEGGKEYNVYIAKKDGKPIAALLLFYYDSIVEYYVPATISEARYYQPLPGIIFQAMRDAAKKQYKYWNWGGTYLSGMDGVYKFKKRWAGKDHPYRYHIFVNNEDILSQSREYLLNYYSDFYTVPFSALREAA